MLRLGSRRNRGRFLSKTDVGVSNSPNLRLAGGLAGRAGFGMSACPASRRIGSLYHGIPPIGCQPKLLYGTSCHLVFITLLERHLPELRPPARVAFN